MSSEERYEDAVRRLASCDYDVLPDDRGYIIRHVTDSDDVSRMHNLDELSDFADLMEWAKSRRTPQSE